MFSGRVLSNNVQWSQYIFCDLSDHIFLTSLDELSAFYFFQLQHTNTIKLSKQWEVASNRSRSLRALYKVIDTIENLFIRRARLNSVIVDS